MLRMAPEIGLRVMFYIRKAIGKHYESFSI